MNKILAYLAIPLIIVGPFIGCAGPQTPGLQTVITPVDNIVDQITTSEGDVIKPVVTNLRPDGTFLQPSDVVEFNLDDLQNVPGLPKEFKTVLENRFPDVEDFALTSEQFVIAGSDVFRLYVPTTEDGSVNWGSVVGDTIGAVGAIVPPQYRSLAVLGGYLGMLLFGKRSRQHLTSSAKAINPLSGGTVDFAGAVSSLGKAVGLVHTNSTPVELRAVADKLEADAKAKDKLTNSLNGSK